MANAPLSAASNAAAAAARKPIVLKEVGAMWAKFSEQALSGLNDDLVTQIMAKYGAGRSEAQHAGRSEAQHKVARLLNGRHI